MASKLSADTLKNNLTNPARPYMWQVVFANPIGGGDGEALTIRAQTTAIPGRSFGAILVPYKASGGVQYPGKLTYSHSLAMTFVEGEDKKIHDAILAWKNYIIDDVDNVGQGDENTKADIYLRLIKLKGNEQYMAIRLIGAWPMAIGDATLDHSTEDVIKYEVTWSFDSWRDDT